MQLITTVHNTDNWKTEQKQLKILASVLCDARKSKPRRPVLPLTKAPEVLDISQDKAITILCLCSLRKQVD